MSLCYSINVDIAFNAHFNKKNATGEEKSREMSLFSGSVTI